MRKDSADLMEVAVTGRYPNGTDVPLLTPGDGDQRQAASAGATVLGNGQAAAVRSLTDEPVGAGEATRPAPDVRPRRSVLGPGWARVVVVAMVGAGLVAGLLAITPSLRRLPAVRVQLPGHAPASVAPWAIAAAVLALAAGAVAIVLLVRGARRALRGQQAEDVLTVLVAAIGSIAAMQGMWRFFGNVLDMPWPLRLLLFGFLDGATLVEALRARRNMRETGSTGIDGVFMWVLTSLSGFLASLDAGSVNAAAFRLAAPEVAAFLWDRGLRLERRRRTGQKIHWRWTPERILVWLGAAEATGRTAGEADVQRRLHRLARSVIRYDILDNGGGPTWRLDLARWRRQSRLVQAVRHTRLAEDPTVQQQLLSHLSALRGAESLSRAQPDAPWTALLPPRGDEKGDGNDGGDTGQGGGGRRRRRRRRQGGGGEDGDGSPYLALADEISDARAVPDYGRVHELLAGRTDYDEFVKWLGASGRTGAKRLMVLAALYACGDINARAVPVRWIAGLVPGDAGRVDKREFREAAAQLRPYWPSDGESPAAADEAAGTERQSA